ncbi:hypothetical protein D1AOALGA4SA_10626 [Olavius algarvensis Delta 1 endosymbiont]|nr:hypothetical protein D1AOALGA4SA_10626 [Olavius algarvensis Delta 1 endosymbiont]
MEKWETVGIDKLWIEQFIVQGLTPNSSFFDYVFQIRQ